MAESGRPLDKFIKVYICSLLTVFLQYERMNPFHTFILIHGVDDKCSKSFLTLIAAKFGISNYNYHFPNTTINISHYNNKARARLCQHYQSSLS